MAYGTDTGFSDWLTANGYTLPSSAPTSAVLRQRASSYIDGLYGSRFTGYPVSVTQTDAWPRTNATGWGQALADTLIPQQIIDAAYAAAYAEAQSPGLLSPTHTPGTSKVLTKVDSLSWTPVPTSVIGPRAFLPVLLVVDGLVAPFLVNGILGRMPAAMTV